MTPAEDPAAALPTAVVDLPSRPPISEWLSPGVLVPVYVLTVTLGYAAFVRGWCTLVGGETGRSLSLMTAVNAATLTGFRLARTNPSDLTPFGQAVTLAMVVAGTMFSLVAGGLAVVRIARLPYRDRTVVIGAAAAVAAAALIGAVTLGGHDRSVADAAYLGVTAFANAGLYLGHLPFAGEWRTGAVLFPLAILGSLGLPVLFDLCRGSLSAHTWRALAASAGVYLLTVAVLVPVLTRWHPPVDLRPAVSTAGVLAVVARSSGFAIVPLASVPAAAGVLLVIPMLIGGVAGGTAGGVKVTTVAVVVAGVRHAATGRPLARAFGIAVGWAVVLVTIVAGTWVGLILADPEVNPARSLTLAAGAVGNVGLSHDPVTASPAGWCVLATAMMLGRVLPVVVLWTVASRMPEVTDPIG